MKTAGWSWLTGACLPGSTDEGWGDKQILADVQAVFGSEAGTAANHENSGRNGGKSFFIAHGIDRVIDTLDHAQPADFKVVHGSADRIYYIHRIKDGTDNYLVVNDDGNLGRCWFPCEPWAALSCGTRQAEGACQRPIRHVTVGLKSGSSSARGTPATSFFWAGPSES